MKQNKAAAMLKKFEEKNLFVTDAKLKNDFLNLDLYNHSQKQFILTEIDKHLSNKNNFGELPDYRTIDTIEHILPQNFHHAKEWKTYLKRGV